MVAVLMGADNGYFRGCVIIFGNANTSISP